MRVSREIHNSRLVAMRMVLQQGYWTVKGLAAVFNCSVFAVGARLKHLKKRGHKSHTIRGRTSAKGPLSKLYTLLP